MNKAQKISSLLIITLALVLGFVSIVMAAQPNLLAAFFVKGKVGLKWSLVAGTEEYQIHRKAPGGEYVQIGTTDEDHFFDTNIDGGVTYIYKIGVTDDGAQVFSGEKSVTTPGSTGAFKAPVWSGAREEPKRIMLNWDKVPGAIAYNVWRSETSGGPYELVGNSQSNRYADNHNLTPGATYYYVVSALNEEFDETPQSAEHMIKFGITKDERDALEAELAGIELEQVDLSALFEIKFNFEGESLQQPADVVVNSQGDIYVLDTLNGAVECFNSNGDPKYSFGRRALDTSSPREGEFLLPMSITVDNQNLVYVGDVGRNDIQVFDAKGGFQRAIKVQMSGDQKPLRPNGLAVLDDGRLAMTDAGNHRWLMTASPAHRGRGFRPGHSSTSALS